MEQILGHDILVATYSLIHGIESQCITVRLMLFHSDGSFTLKAADFTSNLAEN